MKQDEQQVKKYAVNADWFDITGTILAKLAHDLNNLLTPLVAYPELIKAELGENSRALVFVETIEQSVDNIIRITRQMQALAPDTSVSTGTLNMNRLVSSIAEEFRNCEQTLNHNLNLELAEDLRDIIGTPENIEKSIKHILQNAVEAMGDKSGILTVKTRNVTLQSPLRVCGGDIGPGAYVCVSISDTGPGIPQELEERIFDPFVTTKRGANKRGAGLGLSIVYRVIRDHKGGILFTSIPGKGTTFELYFPVDTERQKSQQNA